MAKSKPLQPAADRLGEIRAQISKLEDERKELEREVQEAEILEKVLSGEIEFPPGQEEKLHRECVKQQELEEAQGAREEELSDLWSWVEEFGSHTGACLSGALAGNRALHPLCTCGWNDVATELERA